MKTFQTVAFSFLSGISLTVLQAQSTYATPYAFTTLAGSAGVAGSIDGAGSAARYYFPAGVAVDSAGNLYVADRNTSTVRKITPTGAVSTLAGAAGATGSTDGIGRAARFNNPNAVAVDGSGNVYVADQTNNTIRRITAAGIVATLAGSPGLSGSTDGTGGVARFNSPTGVAVDGAGNVYVADQGNQTIRKITAAGVVTTFAGSAGLAGSTDGTGSGARFSQPTNTAVDGSGNVYVADQSNNTIRKITAAGVVSTLAGLANNTGSIDATGSAARFFHPQGVAVDGSGAVYVADAGNHVIRKVTAAGVVTTLAGTALSSGPTDGTGAGARFYAPSGVAVDAAGNVYVADYANQSIRKITAAGVATTFSGISGVPGLTDGTAGPGTVARFNDPTGVAVDGAGVVYIADQTNHTIRKMTPAGEITTLAGSAGLPGSTDGPGSVARFKNPTGVAVDSSGNVFVADYGNHTIRKITSAGVVSTFAGAAGAQGATDGTGPAARFYNPFGLAADSSGNLYVADSGNSTIRKITSAGEVTTFAGTAGAYGSADGTGAAAQFVRPKGVAVDPSGNIFVVDPNAQTIRRITPAGVVTTLAGTPGTSSSIDGTGSAALFNNPSGVAVDAVANLYVTDTNSGTIRKVTAAGVVTTFAGVAGPPGSADGIGSAARFNEPIGIAVDVSGNFYVADVGNQMIRKFTATGVVTTIAGSPSYGSADGPVSAARYNNPLGVAVDGSGNAFVADTANNTIRKISASGVVTTLAGTAGAQGSTDGTGSAARFYHPDGVAVDTSGNVYVADSYNDTIRKITSGGVVTTLAGSHLAIGSTDGTGSAAQFSNPHGVAVDTSGNVYVADSQNNIIRKITAGGVVTTFAGTAGLGGQSDGTGAAAGFSSPSGVAVDGSGNVYVADTYNDTIRKITSGGVVTTLAGYATNVGNNGSSDGTGSNARFDHPAGVAVDALGNVYVADSNNQTIRKVTPAGVVTTVAGGVGTPDSTNGTGSAARFAFPSGIAVDNSGNLFVADTKSSTIRKVTPAGVVSTFTGNAGSLGSTDGRAASPLFNNPDGVAVDAAGNVYVADTFNFTVRKITPAGVVTTLAGTVGLTGALDLPGGAARFNTPTSVAVDASGNVYVADHNNSTIRKVTSAGVVTTFAGLAGANGGGTGSTNGTGSLARFFSPSGVAVDGSGNVYVADSSNNTIRKITPGAVVTTLAGNPAQSGSADGTGGAALFLNPCAVAVDGSGNVYVADRDNGTIRKVTAAGVVTTLAGTAGPGNVGSLDGAGAAAKFYTPSGVAVDGWGNVYVSEYGNSKIRKITPAGVVTTLAGADTAGALDGTGGAARFYGPQGLAVSPAGVVYVADSFNHTVRMGIPPVAHDFDGNGQSDLVWQDTVTGERRIWLLDGTAYGSEVSLGSISTDWQVSGSADFNGDGHPDLLWQNASTGERLIWLMNGTGFQTAVSLGAISTDWSIGGTGDFDGDGQTDIVWQNTATGERLIWLMNGTSFEAAVPLGVISPQWSIAGAGDLNADGKVDLVWQNTVTGERLIWLMNGTSFGSAVSLGVVSTDLRIAQVEDIDGDGQMDLVLQNIATGERLIWLMTGTVHRSTVSLATVPVEWSIGLPSTKVHVRDDFNGDGQTDLVWENTSTGDRFLWLMNGATFTSSVYLGNLPPAWHIAATGDFDGDDKTDLVWENSSSGDRYVWLMNGTTFSSSVYLGNLAPTWHIVGTGDFNGDGRTDLVWENAASGDRFIWYMNNTTFGSGISLGNLAAAWHIAGTGDFNGDGQTDLVWENTGTGDRYFWLMNGATFISSVSLGNLPPAWHIAGTGDFNGDGQPDLIWENTSTGDRYVWLMNGTTFSSSVYLGNLAAAWRIRN